MTVNEMLSHLAKKYGYGSKENKQLYKLVVQNNYKKNYKIVQTYMELMMNGAE